MKELNKLNIQKYKVKDDNDLNLFNYLQTNKLWKIYANKKT